MFSGTDFGSVILGADPEIAAVNEKGWCIPATTVLRTSSTVDVQEPVEGQSYKGPFFIIDEGFSIQSDGASLEANIPPSRSTDTLIDSLRRVFKVSHELVTDLGLQLEMLSTIPISQQQINKGGIELTKFGCDADFNPYGDGVSQSDVDPKTLLNRFFGGHIHMSPHSQMGDDFFTEYVYEIILSLDMLVGLADVLLDGTSGAGERRKVYGRAGRYRLQPWGFEYRTPGGVYLRSPETTAYMFELTKRATFLATDQDAVYELLDLVNFRALQETINNADQAQAIHLWEKLIPSFNQVLDDSSTLFDAVLGIGVDGGIMQSTKLRDFYKNWSLE